VQATAARWDSQYTTVFSRLDAGRAYTHSLCRHRVKVASCARVSKCHILVTHLAAKKCCLYSTICTLSFSPRFSMPWSYSNIYAIHHIFKSKIVTSFSGYSPISSLCRRRPPPSCRVSLPRSVQRAPLHNPHLHGAAARRPRVYCLAVVASVCIFGTEALRSRVCEQQRAK
jgi:hypothetical protein